MRSLAFSIPLPTQPIRRLKTPVEGLLLDSCDVLYDVTGWRRWMLQVLRRLGLHTHYRCLFHVWEKDYLRAVHRGQSEPCEALRAFLQALGLSRGQIEEVATTCQARRLRWEAEIRLLPGVKNTIREIAGAGIPLAIVSDTEHSSETFREHLEEMGLRDTLTAVVTSRDLGRTKPDPRCYEAALEALDLHARQTAFVGHDADELAGAARLGMQTIAINTSQEVEADILLTRFVDLLDVVDLPTRRNMAG
jgi:HAD superfamily hydrolase (TIGR01509 family)